MITTFLLICAVLSIGGCVYLYILLEATRDRVETISRYLNDALDRVITLEHARDHDEARARAVA